MTTFQELVSETRNHLMTNQSERVSQLLAGIDGIVETLTLKFDAPQIQEGYILGIDFEEVYVVSKSGTTVTVIRAFNGSTAAAHSINALIRISAKFTDFKLSNYVQEAIEDLSGDGLFQLKPYEFTYSPAVSTYNIDAPDMIDIWRVRYDEPGPSQYWRDIRKCDWMLDQHANLTDFPDGKSLTLQVGGSPSHLVRVSYKAHYDPLVLPTDDVEAVSGVHQEAHKLIHYGAAINALGGREVKRTFTERQPEPRRAEEVPPGAMMQSINPFLKMYTTALRRERRRLRRRYPDQVY